MMKYTRLLILGIPAFTLVLASCQLQKPGSSSLTVFFGQVTSKSVSKSMASTRTLGSPNTTAPSAGQAIVYDNTNPSNPVATTAVDLTTLSWLTTPGSGTNAPHLTFNAWLELWNTADGFLNFGAQTTLPNGDIATYAIPFDFASSGGTSIGTGTLKSGASYPYGYLEISGESTSSSSVGQVTIPAGFFYPGSPAASQVIIFFADTMADAQALYTQEHTTNQLILPGFGLCICIVVPGMTPIDGSSETSTAAFDINTAAILDSSGNLVNGWWNNVSFIHD